MIIRKIPEDLATLGMRVSRAIIIVISSRLKKSSDGFDFVIIQMIEKRLRVLLMIFGSF
jgi:hypothetical protein